MQNDYKSVNKYTPRNSNFIQHFKEEWGKADTDYIFDNDFQFFKLIWKLMHKMDNAIKQGVVKIPQNLHPSKSEMEKIDKIWLGGCYYAVVWEDEEHETLLQRTITFNPPPAKMYDKLNNVYDVESIQLQPFRDHVPVNQLKDDVWGVQIRARYPLYVAWQDATYETVVTDGNFSSLLADGVKTRVQPEDMKSTTLRTTILHRPIYHQITGDYGMYFLRSYNVLDLEWQKIIDYVENDSSEFVVVTD